MLQPPNSTEDEESKTEQVEGLEEEEEEKHGKGTWKHAAFHVATTIATPAAYAPLPFALASLGWPLGNFSLLLFSFTNKLNISSD
jgi:hypothetical protein